MFPLCALSKKQTSVSHSTTEAEMVAADVGLRTEAVPLMTLFNTLFKRDVTVNPPFGTSSLANIRP